MSLLRDFKIQAIQVPFILSSGTPHSPILPLLSKNYKVELGLVKETGKFMLCRSLAECPEDISYFYFSSVPASSKEHESHFGHPEGLNSLWGKSGLTKVQI